MLTRAEYKEYFINIYGNSNGWKSQWKEFKMNCDIEANECSFATLQEVKCPTPWPCVTKKANVFGKYKAVPVTVCNQQEGTTPMRYNDNYASANASVSTPKSEITIQRDYLSQRLSEVSRPKANEFEKLFNLYVDNTPKTYKEMIEIIKAGTFTVDPQMEKAVARAIEDGQEVNFGPLCGIVWPGPKQDYEGYRAALKELKKQHAKAEDIIATSDAVIGLKAVYDLEAWVPDTAKQ